MKKKNAEKIGVGKSLKRVLAVLLTMTMLATNNTSMMQAVYAEALPQAAPGTSEPAPTEEPAPVPTEEPTPAPTEEPTPAPTEEPTPAPTEKPSPVPTDVPAVTPAPTPEPTEKPAGTSAPTAAPTPAVTPEPTRAPKDLTNSTDALALSVGRLCYLNTQGESLFIIPENNSADLSKLSAEELSSLAVELDFHALQEVVKGDSFTIQLPASLFQLKNTQEPQPVYNRDGEGNETSLLVGSYEIKDNSLHFTFGEVKPGLTAGEIKGRISLNMAATGRGTQTLLLQNDLLLGNKSECTIVLPAGDTPSSEDKPNVEELVKRGLRLAPRAAAAGSYTGNTYKYTFKKGDAGLNDGFSSVKVTVSNREDGYGKDTPSKERTVKFGFETMLDNDFLYTGLEQLLNDAQFPMPGPGESDEDYNQRLAAWLNSQPDSKLPALNFEFDLGKNFSKLVKSETPIVDAAGESFGRYSVQGGKVSVVFDKEIYAYQDVFATFGFDAQLDDDVLLNDDKKEIGFKDGKIIEQSVANAGGGETDPNASKYKISKDGPALVKESTITYTVSFSAINSNKLNGKYFVDYLPKGLEVLKLELNGQVIDSKNYTIFTDISTEKQELRYQFPDSSGKEITAAEFTVTLGLNDATYKELVDKKSLNRTFKNKAALVEKLGNKGLVESEEVSTDMSLTFLKKTGSQDSLNGSRYRWTVDASTCLPYLDYGYLVDSLCSTYHQYDFKTGITIGGTTYSTGNHNITNLGDVSGYTWEKLTAQDLKTLAAGVPEGNAFYFEYAGSGDNSDNPFKGIGTGTEPDKVRIGILVIPFDNYAGRTEDKSVQMKYFTDLNLHGLTMDQYMKSAAHDSVNVENVVNLLWANKGGQGVGPGTQPDQVKFGKVVDTVIDIMEKKGVSYNPKTRQATWKLTVNKMGANLTDTVITDVLPKGAYENLTVEYIKYDGRTNLPTTGSQPLEQDKYSLTMPTKDADGLLTIELGDIPEQDFYVLTLKATLTDTAILAVGKEGKLTNKAKINADINGTPKESILEGELKIPNTLIEKKNFSTYNFSTHELSWEVKVNPNSLTVENAAVTDTLPAGTSFQKSQLTAVLVDGKEDATLLATVRNSLTEPLYTEINGPKFLLGDITKPVTLRFSTTITDAFMNGHAQEFKDGIEFLNHAELTGTVVNNLGNSTEITDATAESTQKVEAYNINKSGVYNKGEGCVDWDILINIFGKEIQGTTFTEDLWANGRFHELRVGSIRLDAVTLDEKGVPITGSEVPANINDYSLTQGSEGFDFRFPAGTVNRNVYRLRFTTDLRDEAAASDAKISNTVRLDDGHGNNPDISNEDDGGFHGGFDLNEAAGRYPRPRLTLEKVSSNSAGSSLSGSLPLEDAVFSLTAYQIENGVINWGKELHTYEKLRLTNNGKAIFMNIMPSDGIAYLLTETVAPAGYVLQDTPSLFLFADTAAPPFTDNSKVAVNLPNIYVGDLNIQVITPNAATKDYSNKTIQVKNTPSAGAEFSFIKLQPEDYGFSGGTETIKNFIPLAGAEFELAPTGALAGKVKKQTAVSDADGKVTFTEPLDPGTYIVKELTSGENLRTGGEFTLTVSCSSSGIYTHSLSGFKNGLTDGGMDNSTGNSLPAVKNDFLRADLSLTKYIQYQDDRNGNAVDQDPTKNRELLEGAQFKLESNDVAGMRGSYSATCTVGSDGKVKFVNLPVGTYALTEELTPNGMEQSPASYTVEVTDENPGSSTAATVKISNDNTSDEVTDKIIPNIPVTGNISFDKLSWWGDTDLTAGNGEPLAGAEFGLYRKIGNTVSNSPTYKESSGVDGKLTFAGVEYGNYVLRELTTPDGYKKHADITITKTNLTLSQDKTTFTSENLQLSTSHSAGKATVYNDLRRNGAIQFVKKTDEALLEDVGFTLFRKGDSVAGDGTGLVINATGSAYGRYQPVSRNGTIDSVKSASDGTFSITNLPVGDYILLETNPHSGAHLQDDKDAVAVRFTVSTNGDTATKLENMAICDQLQSNMSSSPDFAAVDSFTPAADNTWIALTAGGDGVYTILNHEKYGYVQLNKLYAEKDKDGNRIPTTTAAANATFEIINTSGFKLTLKTDANGHFTHNDKGYYTDAVDNKQKHLHYGDYTIKETTPPANGIVSSAAISFTIGDDPMGGHEGTAWILSSPTAGVRYTKKGEQDLTEAFLNDVDRGTFTLEKRSTDSQNTALLAGAKFTVYSGKTAVASLQEDGSTGKYQLTNKKSSGGAYDATASTGLPYLYQRGSQWYLLSGSYTVKEDSAPQGYELASDFTVKVSETAIQVSGNSMASVSGTTVTLKDAPIQLELLKKDSVTNSPIENVAFYLKKGDDFLEFTNNAGVYTYIGTGTKTDAAKLMTDDKGLASLNQLPVGTYTLMENMDRPGYIKAETILGVITVDEKGHVSTASKEIGLNGTGNNAKPVLTVLNTPNSLEITKKFYRGNTLQSGYTGTVEFALVAKGTGTSITAKAIDGKHKVKFDRIADGVYDLVETTTGGSYIPYSSTPLTVTVGDGKITVAAGENANSLQYANLSAADQQAASATVNNYLTAELQFIKKGEGSSGEVPLEGVEFCLKGTAGDYAATSMADGSVQFTGLVPGTYTLTEKSTNDGYAITDSAFTVTVDEKGVVSITDQDNNTISISALETQLINQKLNLKVLKADEADKPVSGAVLTLKGKLTGGGTEFSWTSGLAPQDLGDKLIGGETYTITEAKRPEGYLTAKPLTFTVEKNGTIKADSGFGTKDTENVLENKSITVRDVTIQGSIALEKILPAAYTGGFSDISFNLYKSVTPVKLDDTAYRPAANPKADTLHKADVTLDKDGKAAVSGLPEGYYYFVEQATRNDLYLDKTPGTVLYIGEQQHGKTVSAQMENKAFTTAVGLKKVDSTDGAALMGTQFTLYRQKGTEWDKVSQHTADAQGAITLSITEKGTYKLQETKAAPGYQLTAGKAPSAVFTVDNTADFQNKTLSLSVAPSDAVKALYQLALENISYYKDGGIENHRKPGTVTLKKTNEAGGNLGGVTFTLYKKDSSGNLGNAFKTAETEADGTLKIDDLPWGDYQIQETKGLDGYQPPKNVFFNFTIGKTATDVVLSVDLQTVTNTRTKLKIAKVGTDGAALSGAKLKLTGEFADQSTEKTWTSEQTPEELLGLLISGERYTLTETEVPAGYIRGEDIVFTMGEDGTITLETDGSYQNGILTMVNEKTNFTVAKVALDGTTETPRSGATLAIYQGTEEKRKWDTTDVPYLVEGLAAGTYTLKELKTPAGYETAEEITFTLSDKNQLAVTKGNEDASASGTAMRVLDRRIYGDVALLKTGKDDQPLKGVTFDLYNADGDQKLNSTPLVSDENGLVTYKNLPYGSYYFIETGTLDDHKLDIARKTFEITADMEGDIASQPKTKQITMKNQGFKTYVQLKKTDNLSPEKGIEGVEFTLSKLVNGSYQPQKTLTTNSDGVLTEGEALKVELTEKGSYRLQETKPAYGYMDNGFTADFRVENTDAFQEKILTVSDSGKADGQYSLKISNPVSGSETAVANERVQSDIKLTKTDEAGTLLAGIKFQLWHKESSQKVAEGITDKDGLLLVKNLDAGTYYFKETETHDDKLLISGNSKDLVVDTTTHTKTLEITIQNKKFEAKAALIKTDAENGNPIKGAEFTLYQKVGEEYKPYESQVVKSNEDGKVEVTIHHKGDYRLTETAPAPGYVLTDPAPSVDFSIQNTDDFHGKTLALADQTNKRNRLEILKKDKDGAAPVAGAEFALRGKFTDGKDSLTWTSKTTAHVLDGLLIAGETYTLSETKAPIGYVKAADIAFTMNTDGSITLQNNPAHGKYESGVLAVDNTKTKFTIGKTALDQGAETPLAGAKLAIYQGETVAKTITGTTLQWTSTTDPYTVEGLAAGTYTLRETETPTGYETAEEITFTLDDQNQVVITAGNEDASVLGTAMKVLDRRIYGDVELKKTGKDGVLLQNVSFDLFKEDGTKLNTEPLITGEDGLVAWQNLPYGSYYFQETATLDDYKLEAAKQEFRIEAEITSGIAAQPAPVKLELENQKFETTASLLKQDAENSNPVKGAEFTLYKKAGGSYEPYEGQVVRSGQDGKVEVTIHHKGDYRLAETAPAPGYTLADPAPYVDFTVDNTDAYHKLPQNLGIIQNTRTNVLVSKLSPEGTALSGAEFKLEGKFAGQEETVLTWTSETDPHLLSGKLIAGESYVLTEVKAPDGYILSNQPIPLTLDQKGILTTGEGDTQAVINEPIRLLVQKFSPQGEKLEGCVFAVTGVFAQAAVSRSRSATDTIIVDDEHPHALEGRLIPGNEYTLQEMTAPNGYVVGGAVKFTVDETGVMELISDSTEYKRDENGNIIMTNDATTVKFAKTDEKGSFLSGAEFTIEGKFADGSEKQVVIPTADRAIEVDALFIEGQRYTLRETKTPTGYIPMETAVAFDFMPGNLVSLVGTAQGVKLTSEKSSETIEKTIFTLTVENKEQPQPSPSPTPTPKPGETAKPSPTATPKPGSPTTGDSRDLGLWLSLSALSLVGIIGLKRRKKAQ